MSNEQNVREYYMLNQRIRDLLFHCKKGLFFKNPSSVLQGASDVKSTKSQPHVLYSIG